MVKSSLVQLESKRLVGVKLFYDVIWKGFGIDKKNVRGVLGLFVILMEWRRGLLCIGGVPEEVIMLLVSVAQSGHPSD